MHRTRPASFVIVALLAAATCATLARADRAAEPAAPNSPPHELSLYQRMGGYNSIAAVSADFVQRLAADPQLAAFFKRSGEDSVTMIHQDVVDLLCQLSGGPCTYRGKDMKAAHQGLGISAAQWELAMGHLGESLDKASVAPKEKQELLEIVAGLEKQIVAAP